MSAPTAPAPQIAPTAPATRTDRGLRSWAAQSGPSSHTSAPTALNARIVAAVLIIVGQLVVLSGVLDRGAGAHVQAWVIPVQLAGFAVALALGLAR